MIATSEVAVSLTIDSTTHLEDIIKDLEKFGTIEVDQELSIICIVGAFDANKSGLGAQVLKALEEIPLRMISYGGSEHNISMLVNTADKNKALIALSCINNSIAWKTTFHSPLYFIPAYAVGSQPVFPDNFQQHRISIGLDGIMDVKRRISSGLFCHLLQGFP